MTGHVYPEIEATAPAVPAPRAARRLPQPRGQAASRTSPARRGEGASTPHSSRGAAFGDYDNDGDVDVLVMNMNEPPSLLRNDYAGPNGWIEVKLEGTRSNRSGLGATVRVTSGGRTTARAVLSQSSYYSHDDLRLHFGLGAAGRAESIEVVWPGGHVDRLRDVEGRRVVTVREATTGALAPVVHNRRSFLRR